MKKNRKGIILAASMLGTLAVASTGFAAFVITADAGATETGNVQVATFDDKSHVVTVTFKDNNKNVVFAPKADKSVDATNGYDYAGNNAWLTNDDPNLVEHLTLSLHIEVTNFASLAETGGLTATLVVNNGKSIWDDAVGEGYIADVPAVTGINKAALKAKTGDTTTGEMDIDLKFAWGSKFSGENPVEHYNKTSITDKEAFATALADARAFFNSTEYQALCAREAGITYLLTISTK